MPAIPPDVVTALTGSPVPGALEPAFVLLTVSPERSVDVCLLSRSELTPVEGGILAVVASRRAGRNLADTPTATLVVVAENRAYYLTLHVRRRLEEEGAMALELMSSDTVVDDIGVELQPMRFRVDERLPRIEQWDRTSRLLRRLETVPPDAGPVTGD